MQQRTDGPSVKNGYSVESVRHFEAVRRHIQQVEMSLKDALRGIEHTESHGQGVLSALALLTEAKKLVQWHLIDRYAPLP